MPYVVTVQFTIKPGQMPTFHKLMLENARASLRDEPGCRQFDVCTDPDRPDQMFLYEVYDDRASFDAHMTMPHFKHMGEASAGMAEDKRIVTYSEIAP